MPHELPEHEKYIADDETKDIPNHGGGEGKATELRVWDVEVREEGCDDWEVDVRLSDEDEGDAIFVGSG